MRKSLFLVALFAFLSLPVALKAQVQPSTYDLSRLSLHNLPTVGHASMVPTDANFRNKATATDTDSTVSVNSTANWYGYASYSSSYANWTHTFIRFSMQDPATVTSVSEELPSAYAAAYAYGYVWFILSNDYGNWQDLYKAPLDTVNGTIGTHTLVASSINTMGTAVSMSYNPTNGRMYFISIGDDDAYYLKSFKPFQPENITTDSLTINAFVLAINAAGEAYCIDYYTGDLYQLDLTDASATLVGNTGQDVSYVQDIAFDMATNELFWAQISSSTDMGLYLVNTETAATTFLGQIGGGGAEITGLFCTNGPAYPIIPTYLNIAGDTIVCAGNTTEITASSDVDGTFTWSTGDVGQTATLGAGTYTVTVTTVTGDSLTRTFNITENMAYEVADTFSICEDQLPYTWNNVTFEAAGTQTVALTTVNGCDSVVTMTLFTNVGIDNHNPDAFLMIYPNPTTGIVNVECTMKNVQLGNVEIQVVDMFGKLACTTETSLQRTHIDISDLAKGIYFVKVVADGNTVAVRKVIKD